MNYITAYMFWNIYCITIQSFIVHVPPIGNIILKTLENKKFIRISTLFLNYMKQTLLAN